MVAVSITPPALNSKGKTNNGNNIRHRRKEEKSNMDVGWSMLLNLGLLLKGGPKITKCRIHQKRNAEVFVIPGQSRHQFVENLEQICFPIRIENGNFGVVISSPSCSYKTKKRQDARLVRFPPETALATHSIIPSDARVRTPSLPYPIFFAGRSNGYRGDDGQSRQRWAERRCAD